MNKIKPIRRSFSKYGYFVFNTVFFLVISVWQGIELYHMETVTPKHLMDFLITIACAFLWLSMGDNVKALNKSNAISKKINFLALTLLRSHNCLSDKELEAFRKILEDEDEMEDEDLKPFLDLSAKDDVPNPTEYAQDVLKKFKKE